MKNKRIAIQVLIVFLSALLFVFSGCGKKGPPMPPEIKGQKIAAPFDLTYTLDGQEITFSWNHKIDKETATVKPEGFEIFMAKKTVEACEGCPFEFEKTGVISMPAMEFSTRIEKGFKYYFRVQATGENNMRSEYSKTVQFEYK